jgi:hypothetical protein
VDRFGHEIVLEREE